MCTRPLLKDPLGAGGGGGGGEAGSQKFVHQKWPDQIFPMVSFDFSHCGHFGLGEGGPGGCTPPPPPAVYGHSFILPLGWGGAIGGPGKPTHIHIRKLVFRKKMGFVEGSGN